MNKKWLNYWIRNDDVKLLKKHMMELWMRNDGAQLLSNKWLNNWMMRMVGWKWWNGKIEYEMMNDWLENILWNFLIGNDELIKWTLWCKSIE